MTSVPQDLRYGLRMLARNPGFTAVAVLTLALGIGANTAIFSVINAVILQPLPYPESSRIVHFVWGPSDSDGAVSPLESQYWTAHSQAFESYATYVPGYGWNLTGRKAQYVHGATVSKDFFSVLGVGPVLGRSFTAEEDRPNGPRVAILSEGLWRRSFGSDPAITGRTINLNGQPTTVVGVLPPNFAFVEPGFSAPDVWTPLALVVDPQDNGHNYEVIARLKRGVKLQQAEAQMDALFPAFQRDYPKHASPTDRVGVRLVPYREWISQGVRTPMLILLIAVGLVLLIATANVTNLLLGRAAAREAEIAVRLSLGASRSRLFRQFIIESLLVAVLGGALGILVAPWAMDALLALSPKDYLPLVGQVRLDFSLLLFAAAVTLASGISAGVAPALHGWRVDLNRSLKSGSRTASLDFGRGRLRAGLVAGELAVSVVLLAAAMLLISSLLHLWAVKPGFDPAHVWTFRMSLPPEKFKTTAQAATFKNQVMERLKTLPGVTEAAATSNLPLEQGYNFGVTAADGGEKLKLYVQARAISPDYFQVMGVPLLHGRPVLESDTSTSAPVVVINEAMARRCCKGRDPLAGQIVLGGAGSAVGRQIVGVVSDAKELGLDSNAPATIFVSQTQMPDGATTFMDQYYLAAWVVKSSTPLRIDAVQRVVNQADGTQPVIDLLSMNEILANSVSAQRFITLLVGAFAGLALALAAIGLYGVLSFSVAQRTHEIGLRMALGARRWNVLTLVVGQGLRLALVGAGIGLIAALALTRLMRSLLFGVTPGDPASLAGVAAVLIGVALVACYVPARRAAKLDPMEALRYE